MLRIGQEEMERFFEGLVASLQAKGVACAITSGMACVEFGVAPSTKDCDVLCAIDAADEVRRTLDATSLRGARCGYRSHLSAPLDPRWLGGGWTSHFAWRVGDEEAVLDVFGVAPRGSVRWDLEHKGLYASPHTVAEMKRTDRPKDWPFASALGVKLIEAGDPRGWLHIFDIDVLQALAGRIPVPTEIIAGRPVLGLLVAGDERLEKALEGEVKFWQRLDRVRMRIYHDAVRPYAAALNRDPQADAPELGVQHACRVRHAECLLAINPMRTYGLERLIAEAKEQAAALAPAGALAWLPDVRNNFTGLAE